MSDPVPNTTVAVPGDWLLKVVKLVDEMAREGIGMTDCADPADLMCDFATHMNVLDADDWWEAASEALQERAA